MAKQARIRLILSVLSVLTVLSTLLSSRPLRATLAALFHPRQHPWRFTALALAALLNLKSFPLVWHLRFFRIMIHQLYTQPTPLPRDALFRPIVTKGLYTPLPECDFNGHKSNSTYFADFDMARTALVSALLRKGIREAGQRKQPLIPLEPAKEVGADGSIMTKVANGHAEPGASAGVSSAPAAASSETASSATSKEAVYAMALGAVHCSFKRELKPYQRFDIWTRILSWDRKWIYILSHMVQPGACPPTEWGLQPWKTAKGTKRKPSPADAGTASDPERRAQWKRAIFATSIAKYVIKHGRMTVPPQAVWERNERLPPRPGHANGGASPATEKLSEWTWDAVEAERLRGLAIAEKFGALDADGSGLHDEFPVARGAVVGMASGEVGVLGEYWDLVL